jgi:hypothetical protein
VRDGKFEFVVEQFDLQHAAGLPQPRGQWVVVKVGVTNIGNEPQSFFAPDQKPTDARAGSTRPMTRRGFGVNVLVPFDIPPGTQPAQLELHDSMFFGGGAVKLR